MFQNVKRDHLGNILKKVIGEVSNNAAMVLVRVPIKILKNTQEREIVIDTFNTLARMSIDTGTVPSVLK